MFNKETVNSRHQKNVWRKIEEEEALILDYLDDAVIVAHYSVRRKYDQSGIETIKVGPLESKQLTPLHP
jgi:hypothetical protein